MKKRKKDLENGWGCSSWKEGGCTSKAHEEWGQNLKPKGVIFIYAVKFSTVLEKRGLGGKEWMNPKAARNLITDLLCCHGFGASGFIIGLAVVRKM